MWPIKGDKGTKKNEFRRMETGMYGSLILLEKKNTHKNLDISISYIKTLNMKISLRIDGCLWQEYVLSVII